MHPLEWELTYPSASAESHQSSRRWFQPAAVRKAPKDQIFDATPATEG